MFTKVIADTRSSSSMAADGRWLWSPLVQTMFGQFKLANCSTPDEPRRCQMEKKGQERMALSPVSSFKTCLSDCCVVSLEGCVGARA